MAIELTLLEETKRIAAAGVPVGATEIVAEFIANGKVIKPTKVVEFYQFGNNSTDITYDVNEPQ